MALNRPSPKAHCPGALISHNLTSGKLLKAGGGQGREGNRAHMEGRVNVCGQSTRQRLGEILYHRNLLPHWQALSDPWLGSGTWAQLLAADVRPWQTHPNASARGRCPAWALRCWQPPGLAGGRSEKQEGLMRAWLFGPAQGACEIS